MKNPAVTKIFLIMVACIVFIIGFSEIGIKTYRAYFSGELFGESTMIGPVDVSNLTKEEAKSKLLSEISTWKKNGEITLTYGGVNETLPKGEIIDFAADATVEAAKSGRNNELHVLVRQKMVTEMLAVLTNKETNSFKIEELIHDIKQQASTLSVDSIEINLVDYIVVDETQTVSTALIQNIINESEITKWVEEIGEIKLEASKEFSLQKFIEQSGVNFSDRGLSIIATGIYETILPTNFEIVERHISAQLPSYAKLGYEVLFKKENKDFIIYNVNPYEYTLHFTLVEGGFEIHMVGANFINEYEIKLENMETFEPKTIIQYSSTLQKGQTKIVDEGKDGQIATVYRYVYQDSSEYQKIKISEDYYPPIHKIEVQSLIVPEAPNEDNDDNPFPDNSLIPDPIIEGPTDMNDPENENNQDKDDGHLDDNLWDQPEHIKGVVIERGGAKNECYEKLGHLLMEAGLITEAQLKEALQHKDENQRLGDILLQMGFITELQLIEVLEMQLGIPHVSLFRYPIDSSLTSTVPKEFAKRHNLMPLKREGDKLFVAMSDPLDFYAIEDLRLLTGFQIETAIASKDEIVRAINKYYDLDEGIIDFIEDKKVEDEEEVTNLDSPIVKLVNQILQNAVQQRASDIHIDPQETKVVLRYRVDGLLRVERTLPKSMQNVLTARIKIMANLNITENRIPQDGRIKINLDFHPIDLRVSTLPTVYGEKIVMRVLDLGNTINNLEKLGFNKLNLQRFTNLIEQPTGIVLITGPTGSGKSSTLYAALNKLNSEEVNIITIEDPVEYQLEGINQIQVRTNVGMTFATGLRAILRQDPNIIMIGEIRDRETADIAVRASLTGHLVLSTLHTNDSLGTITRLIDMGVEPFLVASSLSGVLAQRLVRRVCRACSQEYEPTKREREIFEKRGISIEKINRGRGCGICNMTGYKGRIAIHELLVIDDDMRSLIMNGEEFSKLREVAIRNKTIFLIDDGLLKVKQGITTTEEILRVAIAD